MSEQEEKKSSGRPTKYKEEYCEMLVDHMAQGLSFESFAGVLSVSRDTVYEWAKEHDKFSDAKKAGIQKCRLFWEKLGIDNIISKTDTEKNGQDSKTKSRSINSGIWVYNMKCRFRDEWMEKSVVEHKGEGITIKIDKQDGEL